MSPHVGAAEKVMLSDALLYSMAREQVNDRNLHDDCVQEARIALWQASLKPISAGKKPAYFHSVARNAILDVSRRGLMTGMPRANGRYTDPMRRRGAVMSLDAPYGESGTLMDTVHDYDRDREIPARMSGDFAELEWCSKGLHLMAESRRGEGKKARCGECDRERHRARRRNDPEWRAKQDAQRRARRAALKVQNEQAA